MGKGEWLMNRRVCQTAGKATQYYSILLNTNQYCARFPGRKKAKEALGRIQPGLTNGVAHILLRGHQGTQHHAHSTTPTTWSIFASLSSPPPKKDLPPLLHASFTNTLRPANHLELPNYPSRCSNPSTISITRTALAHSILVSLHLGHAHGSVYNPGALSAVIVRIAHHFSLHISKRHR